MRELPRHLLRRRAHGGRRVHLIPATSNKALCGFEPSKRWVPDEPHVSYKPCLPCYERAWIIPPRRRAPQANW